MNMRWLALPLAAAAALAAGKEPTPEEIQEIIRKFAAQETAFAKARENYTYRQTSRLQELDDNGNRIGSWEETFDVVFTSAGKREEKVVRAPVPALRNLILTPEDLQDMRSVQPFVLTTAEIPNYNVNYLGRERLDEIDCYVFAVRPKRMEPGKRYFAGIVWVDEQELQIVKSYGRATGLTKRNQDSQYPKFETFREQIDGKYWFPTYTVSNDTLVFDSGLVQKIKMTVRYAEYKQFKSDVKITFGDEVTEPAKPKPPEPRKP
jgi:hypothetical protein